MFASADLDEEHRLITALMDALHSCTSTKGQVLDVVRAEQLVDALANCLGQLHIVKEERVLFPLLQARGLPRDHAVVAALLDQHESGRAYLRRLRSACTWVRARREGAADELRTLAAEFRDLVHEHVRIEDEYFYEMARRQLLPEDLAPLERAFASLDEAVQGPAIRRRAREILDTAGPAPPASR
jgi:hemerythrin-like domain-containing protein